MDESILLKIQEEITDILVDKNPDEEIQIFSRTKGDTENDIQNALLTLSQGISVLPPTCESTLPNVSTSLVLDKVSVEIHTISGTSLEPKYDASQLAEWVARVMHQRKLSIGSAVYVENIAQYSITDNNGAEIEGASGVSVSLVVRKVVLPRIF